MSKMWKKLEIDLLSIQELVMNGIIKQYPKVEK